MKKRNPIWFNISFLLMTLMAMFRYGQLADYFNYKELYEERNAMEEWRDPLYTYFAKCCFDFGLDYEVFIIIVGAFSMGIIYPFFSKYCKYSITALFVFYCYAFLILPMTAMRQGICLSILLWGYHLLMEGKTIKFCLLVLIGGFIHISMFAVFLIPILLHKPWYNSNLIKWIVLGLTIVALITPDLSRYMVVFSDIREFEADSGSRFLQVSIRALLIIPLLLIKPDYKTNGYNAKAICIIGYCMYCILAFNLTYSARIEFYFRVFMCLFVSYSLYSMKKIYLGRLLFSSIIAIHVFLFFKNMGAAIQQGDYNENKVSMFNFPYVSIFDEDELDQYK